MKKSTQPMATRITNDNQDWRNGWSDAPEPVSIQILAVIGGLVLFPCLFAFTAVGWWLGW